MCTGSKRQLMFLQANKRVILWGLTAILVAGVAASALAQSFVSMGPAPSFGPTETVQSADVTSRTGTVGGAVQAIVLDPKQSITR